MKKLSILTVSILSLVVALPTQKAIAVSYPLIVNSQSIEQQAQNLYDSGKFEAAIPLLEQAIKNYTNQGDVIGQVIANRNLALVYQKMGKWEQGKQAIANSLHQIEQIVDSPENQKLLAQILEVQAQIQLSMGHSQEALDTWKRATDTYEKLADSTAIVRSKINQAQALQALGLYTQAVKTLTETKITLDQKNNDLLKAKGLKSLGDVQREVGQLKDSQETLKKSLSVAQAISSSSAMTEALLSLGKTARLQNNTTIALDYYQKAVKQSPSPDLLIQAQLHQLQALIEVERENEAKALIPEIQSVITKLQPSRTAVYSRITFGKILLKLEREKSYQSLIANELAKSIQLAKNLEDKRAESYAMGILGNLYEKNNRYSEARELTEKALLISQGNNAPDLSYQWQWQLGRILTVQKQQKSAIAAYSQSVKTLKYLRTDLVAISSDVQFSFRESVEPVYRELVDLLLQPGASQENLKEAREVIESLQLAELDNFFRNACLDAKPVQIDQLDTSSAIFYSIILKDRLEVIVAFPGKPLHRHTTNLSKSEIESNLEAMRATLASPRERIFNKKRLKLSQKIYSWLINPIASELKNNNIKNLVFISDGALRNIPLSTLHDGKKYLIEKYSISLAPSLQLIDPKSLVREKIQLLGGGVSEARQGFPPLPNVVAELNNIKEKIPSSTFLKNSTFTDSNLEQKIKEYPYQIVHFATHGEFSSSAEGTFVLTWDEKLTLDQLNHLLRSDKKQINPIELLVLSACRTAAGDNRASLGLAGVAVRSGARSTIASLWYVDDKATSKLMTQFYQELANSKNTKSEALRRAQIAILKDDQFAHPYYWSAFVIIGNWL